MTRILIILFATVSFALAAEGRRNLVVLGDSIAAGYGLDSDEAFPAILQQKINEANLPYHVVNAGVSGDTTAGGLRRISWILKQPLDLLLIELGGNDGLRGITPEETEKNLQAIIDKVREKYPAASIVISGMQMPASMGKEFTERYRSLFGAVAKRNGAALVPFLLENVGGRADLNQPDRIHPTVAGHKIVADNVWKTLEPILLAASKKTAG